MGDREELQALRRMAELEAKASGPTMPASPPAEPTTPDSPVMAGAMGAVKGALIAPRLGLLSNEIYERGSDVIGSAVTEGSSRIGLPSEVAAGLGTAAYVGAQSLPVIAGSKIIGQGSAPALESGAKRLMQSSIKPNAKTIASGDAPKAIQTMLDRGINATEGGMKATQARVTALEGTIDDLLKNSPATVDKFEVAKNLKTAVQQVNLNLERAANVKEIQGAYEKFWNHEAIKNLDKLPASLANKMKQAFYKELSEKAYVPGASLSAQDKAQKALAAGLREGVAKAEPAVAPTLAEQAELINVLKVAGPQAGREGNKNIIGLGSLSPTLQNAAVWMLDRYPWFKSMLARGMYSGSTRIPQAAAGVGMAAGKDVADLLNR